MTTLFPYQALGAKHLAHLPFGGGGVLDDMGLGKSAQAVRALDMIGAPKALIICPAALKANWAREVAKFGLRPRQVDVVQGRKHRIDLSADVVVVNYDLAVDTDLRKQFQAFAPQAIICDEAHFLKNPSAKRTQAVIGRDCSGRGGLLEHASHRWALTGTPAPNHPGELWPLLRAFAPAAITNAMGRPMRQDEFTSAYCVTVQTGFGSKVLGGRNLPELAARMRPFFLRRTKGEVLTDLPPFRADTILLSAGDAAKRILSAEHSTPGAALLAGELRGGSGTDDALRALISAAPHLATLRKMTGLLKAPLVADLVRYELDNGLDKIVIMAVHREVIASLAQALTPYNPQVLHGGVSDRQAPVDRFQNDPQARVFIGQVQAAGTGITLTAASHLLFAEISWVPAENAQAAMRVHRIGQNRAVLVRFATVSGTVDEMVVNAVRRKTRTLTALLG